MSDAHLGRTALFRSALPLEPGSVIRFAYVNWQGHRGERHVRVLGTIWGATEWHPEPQALLLALDLDKNEERAFALSAMSAVTAG